MKISVNREVEKEEEPSFYVGVGERLWRTRIPVEIKVQKSYNRLIHLVMNETKVRLHNDGFNGLQKFMDENPYWDTIK